MLSNVLVISRKGKILGVSECEGVEEITELISDKVGGYIDPLLNERLLGVLSTKENVNLETLGFGPEVKKYQRPSSPPLILPVSGWVRCSCTNAASSMRLMILF